GASAKTAAIGTRNGAAAAGSSEGSMLSVDSERLSQATSPTPSSTSVLKRGSTPTSGAGGEAHSRYGSARTRTAAAAKPVKCAGDVRKQSATASTEPRRARAKATRTAVGRTRPTRP